VVFRKNVTKTRFHVATQKGLTPLVGRDEELGLLRERWQLAKAGNGQVIVISGEAGIGKSRLIQAFKEEVATERYTRVEYQCSPYAQNSALYPAIDYLQRLLAFTSDESVLDKVHKLESLLEQYTLRLQETVPLFASLLSLPLPEERYPALSLTPELQKQKTLESIWALLFAAAERQPVCMIVEDLHWIDPSTLEYITQLIDRISTTRFLILLTCRPEFQPTWGKPPHLNNMELERLSSAQVREMVPNIQGGGLLDDEVTQQLAIRSDGVPLFVEELTKMIVESKFQRVGQESFLNEELSQPLTIPGSLQDLLMARLDRLGTAKELAQIGATLGREFSYNLLKAAADLDEVVLQSSLNTLVTAELLQKRDHIPQARYKFRHGLIQEAAYQSLLDDKRQQYHRQISQALEKQFSHIVEAQPELLAHHFTEAGATEEAIEYWQKAGEKALQRSANNEAISHITRGLGLVQHLSATPQRLRQELQLQMTIGVPLMATKGYAAPEVKQAYDRSQELCQQVGETFQLVPILRGLAVFHHARAELETARKLGEQILQLVRSQSQQDLLLEAYKELGGTLFNQGEFSLSLSYLEQGLSYYDPQKHHSHTILYGQDPRVSCLSLASNDLWLLGYPDKALAKNKAALTLAQEGGHPHSLAYALTFLAVLHQFRREPQGALQRAEETIQLATEQGFPIWESMGTMLRGWALAQQDKSEEGIEQLQQGLVSWRFIGAEVSLPYYLALLAEAYRKTEQFEKSMQLLTEALILASTNGDRWWEAELHRQRGELLLQQRKSRKVNKPKGAESEVEGCFLRAMDIAHNQKAKSLELRAAMSISRLWNFQNKEKSARQLLVNIYEKFTEGFDTEDLKEAAILIQSLS
jgi:predicted ATPase